MYTLCWASSQTDRHCCPLTKPHDSEVSQPESADVLSLYHLDRSDILWISRDNVAGELTVVRQLHAHQYWQPTTPCTTTTKGHWGLRTVDFRCEVMLPDKRWLWTVHLKKATQLIHYTLNSYSVWGSNSTMFTSHTMERILQKDVIYRKLSHKKEEHIITMSPDLQAHKLAFF